MTINDAIAQRDSILQNMGISKSQYQGRSMEFPAGDARIKEINFLNEYIQQLQDQQSGMQSTRCTYAKFNRG